MQDTLAEKNRGKCGYASVSDVASGTPCHHHIHGFTCLLHFRMPPLRRQHNPSQQPKTSEQRCMLRALWLSIITD